MHHLHLRCPLLICATVAGISHHGFSGCFFDFAWHLLLTPWATRIRGRCGYHSTILRRRPWCHCDTLWGMSGSLWPHSREGPSRVWLGAKKMIVEMQTSMAGCGLAQPKVPVEKPYVSLSGLFSLITLPHLMSHPQQYALKPFISAIALFFVKIS